MAPVKNLHNIVLGVSARPNPLGTFANIPATASQFALRSRLSVLAHQVKGSEEERPDLLVTASG